MDFFQPIMTARKHIAQGVQEKLHLRSYISRMDQGYISSFNFLFYDYVRTNRFLIGDYLGRDIMYFKEYSTVLVLDHFLVFRPRKPDI